MATSRRNFIRDIGLGFAAAHTVAFEAAVQAGRSGQARAGGSERLLVARPHQPNPAPVGYDRLPLAWYKAAAQRLREAAAARGLDAVLLQTDHNIVYFTGCFRQSGQRTTWALLPVKEPDTVYWFSPGIDRDLIESWWSTANDYYFCYPHAEGGFPNKGQIARGTRVDLWDWMLAGLKRRGYADKKIGIDVPQTPFENVSDLCLGFRIIKTPEEIALTLRAYRYFDRIHAFARDYVLERGTSATDFEVGQALAVYGINLMMQDVKRDGAPHTAVGIDVTSQYVRAGVATAYPHPNQFFHSPIRRGQPLYVNTDILLGGYGGECYRNYVIEPWDAHHEKMWQVVSDTVQIMVEEAVPGTACSEVAEKIHRYQIEHGMQDYIYHRPGHGQGQNYEGHQPPYIALGDDTVIREGMTFSVEPGLYDPRRGIGVNPSDRLLVLKDRAVLMSRVPFSREWSFLKL